MTSDEGLVFEVTAGGELYSPIQFNNFTVGPLTVKGTVRSGETLEQAFERVRVFLHGQMKREYVAKRAAYLENFKALKG